MTTRFDFDFRTRRPSGPLGLAVESIWYARGTVPYARERIAPTGSTVAVLVLGDAIRQTAGDGGERRAGCERVDDALMPSPQEQAATQLSNIERDTGLTPAAVVDLIRSRGVDRHGQIVALLKAEHGLGHGNANLLSVKARELLAGGPPASSDLLDAQYAAGKAALRPVHDEIVAAARTLGDDVEVVVQKTAVSLRRRRQFGVVRAASSRRVELGLNLPRTPESDRVREVSGMCSHRVDLAGIDDVDDAVRGWLRAAYDAAG